MPRYTIHIARNLTQNLDAIRLFDTIIPNLQRFPEMGRDLLSRRPRSVEGLSQREKLRNILKKGATIREYIGGDYLLLYAVRGEDIFLLSIKHHLQLSFDLKGHWSEDDVDPG